jgi:DNA-binding transcriptional LysR family regulator
MLTGSMTAAGTYLGVSQPAVSRLIHDLEHQLQLALFARQGAHVVPTPEAVLLYEEVRRSFAGLEQIAQTAAEIRASRAGSLRIAAMPALALGYLAKVVAGFLAERPNLSIKLHSDSSQKS